MCQSVHIFFLGPSRLGSCMPRGRNRRKASTAAWCRSGRSGVHGPPGMSSSLSPAARARTTCLSSHRPSSASIATHWSGCCTHCRKETQCTARRSRYNTHILCIFYIFIFFLYFYYFCKYFLYFISLIPKLCFFNKFEIRSFIILMKINLLQKYILNTLEPCFSV